ncbi:MAG: ATP-dependent Clp protease ATP-binding subunit, partial [Clostridia bacterium]|nr:ATP-dependent Clp protease ATP-binding subunit [Clostridia bacterium]
KKKKKKRKYLNTYCTDLTERAREGKLDRVIGRDKEIERITQILCRRSKNNPCLIGEPGVGKTAIAEGLAIRIAEGNVPAKLEDKEIHLLDLTALVAGTQFRGQFESRIKGLVAEVRAEGNIILFIDEVHSLVGTGDAEGTMNAANILKPSLSRGEIQVIGATTFKEYRKHIEKDAALERRFQPVTVNEPSVDETCDILLGIKDYYSSHHHVAVSDALLRRAVVLSERYITDRFLPDKAIDLLDEACACASLRNIQLTEYDKLTRKHAEKKARLEALAEETENPDFEAQAELRTELLQLEDKIKQVEPAALSAAVTEADLAKVIELWTGIPASKIVENEQKRLSKLEDRLKEKIIGQDEAVSLVAAAIRRSRVQISPNRHPASFIFVGPTGVGKTELVKVLAAELFNSPETLIRLDMSEYMEKHSVAKIIGSPPGYIGYDEAGQLTEKVRRKPYSVLLFDEIEKAHPDVLNILLQILDEGKITDAQGRVVNFENTVIIMTSNAGSDRNGTIAGFGKTAAQSTKEHVMKALSEFLRPEFIARVDEIVAFNPLTKEDFAKIAVLMLDGYVKTLAERDIKLIYNSDVPAFLAEKSHGGKSAARDLRNLIRREAEDKIALLLVENPDEIPREIVLSVDSEKCHLTVTANI